MPDGSAATFELEVTGMTCAGCAGRVERTLRETPGVAAASVNFATGRAHVETGPGAPDGTELAQIVTEAGYSASPAGGTALSTGDEGAAETVRALARDVLIAGCLTVPVVLLEMGGHLIPAFHHFLTGLFGAFGLKLILFALTTAVLAGPGRVFFRKGWQAFRNRAPDMNSLVMLGTGTAWVWSTLATFAPGLFPAGGAAVYFEPAALIVTLVLLGRWLEARARGRTGAAIQALVRLTPQTAELLRDGGEVTVPLESVIAGDVLRVRPGSTVPVDGRLLEGETWIDESMLTGEVSPVRKSTGAAVTGGTLNGTGGFTMRAEKVGADTVLARIIRMVGQAQADKLPVQDLVDRVTLWFVPAIIGIAVLTLAVWLLSGAPAALAVMSAAAVLIVACPCAMGLATPTSILTGTGRAAGEGVLFRRGAALQTLSGVRTIAFDKTGTLTEGRMHVTEICPAEGFSADGLLSLAATAESGSEHPLARAIAGAAREAGLPVPPAQKFQARPGLGASASADGRSILAGSPRFLESAGVPVEDLQAEAERLAQTGASPVMVAVDGRLAGCIGIADRIRPGAAETVSRLREMGLDVAMITGDNAATAGAVARQLGISRVLAEVMPGAKADAVRELQTDGAVAFVGDGINDAPALASADTGIAIGTGTDIAIETGDAVLMSGDPAGVADAVAISRATMRNIRQNLGWAFGYNIALIPVAAGILYPAFGITLSPVLAAAAMAASSVCVVGNALRLRTIPLESHRSPAR